jgi:DNA-binding MarR family transcriptional regulator
MRGSGSGAGSGTDYGSDDAATSAWKSMRSLVLDLHDRRGAVSETIGMSYLRAKALRQLTSGPLPMRELAAALSIDAPYTTVIVDDLEQRGLVERQVHPADRRSKLVRITTAGRAVARKADKVQSAPPAPLRDLDTEELATLQRLLARLVDESTRPGIDF